MMKIFLLLFSFLLLSSCTVLKLTANGNAFAQNFFRGVVVQYEDGEGNIRYSRISKSGDKVTILDEDKKVLKVLHKKDFEEIMQKY